jgi:hypothetical protein
MTGGSGWPARLTSVSLVDRSPQFLEPVALIRSKDGAAVGVNGDGVQQSTRRRSQSGPRLPATATLTRMI